MPKLVMVLMFGMVMFAASAAGSWFVQQKLSAGHAPAGGGDAADAHGGGHGDEHAAAGGGHGEQPADSHDGQSHGDSSDTHVAANALSRGPVADPLQVAVRPRDWSPEELLKKGMDLRKREQEFKKQEALFEDRKIRQNTAFEDLKSERREIDGLRVQLNDQLKHAETLVDRMNEARVLLEQSKGQLEAEMKKNQSVNGLTETDIATKNKKAAEWIQIMEPEEAKELVKQMANNGQKEVVAQMFSSMEPQQVSAILAAILADKENALVQELIEAYQKVKPPVKNTK